MDLSQAPHRRYNPLTREWVLVSPHRTNRPWQGQVEKQAPRHRLEYDPTCYLCPRNERAGGVRNPDFESTFVFDNDFAALLPDAADLQFDEAGLLRAESERGLCRVVCFSPRHDLTLSRMEVGDIAHVVDVWQQQSEDIGARLEIKYVQIFENRGEMMGCSNPHPHGQIWATERLPNEPAKELDSQREYFKRKGSSLLGDYLAIELKKAERVVLVNEHFAALVPFWAVWPFETLLIARRAIGSFSQLNRLEKLALADAIQRLTARYDALFETAFPYSMGFHPAPCDGASYPEWRFHAHFYPPLLRSATVRKFMVGFEMLGMPQRDFTPEAAAAQLRDSGADTSEIVK